MTDFHIAIIVMIILFTILAILMVVDIVVNLMQYRYRRHMASRPRTPMPPRFIPETNEGE